MNKSDFKPRLVRELKINKEGITYALTSSSNKSLSWALSCSVSWADLVLSPASGEFCSAEFAGGVDTSGGGVDAIGGRVDIRGDGGRVLGLAFGLNRPRSPLTM